SAKLFRSRPNPDGNGSIPTGWRASCTSGAVTAVAHCAWTAMNFDFTSCRTRRATTTNSTTQVNCNAGELAIGRGGYCGGGKRLNLLSNNFTLVNAVSGCSGSGSTNNAYAV